MAKSDHTNADCFACAVLSHGDEVHVVDKREPGKHEREDLVYAIDQIVLTREIVELFRDEKCPSLLGKPRLFFIQVRLLTFDLFHLQDTFGTVVTLSV